ncbi:sensor domain-containing diguanylate cyclase [Ilumatobacter fluminis]|uniref:sensor domain-containing diguanylate cyclase n=1 Tax=Ilumatobacter fluminis TaxID=467091 RepID=UPI00141502E2|nr:diguanylate cyclase [Ilumatobacter fluminis]
MAIVAASLAAVLATSRANKTSAADETVARIGDRTADLVMAHLDVAAASLDQIDAVLTDAEIADRDDRLDRVLAAQLVAHDQLSGSFVGYPDGDFVFAYRDTDQLMLRRIDTTPTRRAIDHRLGSDLATDNTFVIETDYDPTTRPWYLGAAADVRSAWTEPYVFFRSGQPGVTLARARRVEGSVTAVTGVDISLAELRSFLDDLPIDDGAEAFLIAGTTIVAAPTGYDLDGDGDELPSVEVAGVTFDQLHELVRSDAPVDIGADGRLHLTDLPGANAPSWSVLIRTDDVGVVGALDQGARIALLMIAVAGICLLVATPWLTRWLRRPIEELRRMARIDELTEVTNRGTFLSDAEAALDDVRQHGGPFVVALVDVDDFKRVNDTFGHAIGDDVLRRIGEAIKANVRGNDLVGRLGGDELAIVIRGTGQAESDRILRRVRTAVVTACAEYGVDITIGASRLAGRTIDLAGLMIEADHELLVAKRQGGKGQVHWADPEAPDPTPLRLRLE